MNTIIRKILLAIIICLISISLIELAFKGVNKVVKNWNEKQVNINNQQNTKNNIVVNKDAKDKVVSIEKNGNELSMVIEDFIVLICGKQYNEAYELLKQDFREKYFPDVNIFTEEVNKSFYSKNGKSVSLIYFDKINPNVYLCKVKINEFEPPPEDPVGYQLNEYFTIEYKDDSTYNIAFRGFVSCKSLNKEVQVGKIKISAKEELRYEGSTTMNIEFFNGEQQPVQILDKKAEKPNEGITVVNNDAVRQYTDNVDWDKAYIANTDFTIVPGAIKVFEIPFAVFAKYEISKIQFNNILVGDETKKAEIEVKR